MLHARRTGIHELAFNAVGAHGNLTAQTMAAWLAKPLFNSPRSGVEWGEWSAKRASLGGLSDPSGRVGLLR